MCATKSTILHFSVIGPAGRYAKCYVWHFSIALLSRSILYTLYMLYIRPTKQYALVIDSTAGLRYRTDMDNNAWLMKINHNSINMDGEYWRLGFGQSYISSFYTIVIY